MGSYWDQRCQLKYYRIVDKLLTSHSPGEMLVDVGCYDTEMILRGDFAVRVTIDPYQRPELEGVETLVADWMQVELPRATVIMCLQTLEHLPDALVYDFALKLRKGGNIIIVSVPYKWPKGLCKYHCQDPIDQVKLDGFMKCKALSSEIATETNGIRRLVCTYPSLNE